MDPITSSKLNSPIKRPEEPVAPATKRPAERSKDALQITAFAEALQAIESESSADAIVDSSRVVDVQQALASGRYEINNMRVATKLFNFEVRVHG